MAAVSTTTGTYSSNLFIPQVVGDMVEQKFFNKVVLTPITRVDYSLQGRPGDTITLPKWTGIGEAEVVPEGNDIPIKQVSQTTTPVKVKKIGVAIQYTDEAQLAGYGSIADFAVEQISDALASTVDTMLFEELAKATKHTNTLTANMTPANILTYMAMFGEDMAGPKYLFIPSSQVESIYGAVNTSPAYGIASNLAETGNMPPIYGMTVIVTDRLKNNAYVVRPGALALYSKRETLIEDDRDIINESVVIKGSKIFAPYLYNESNVVKITLPSSGA